MASRVPEIEQVLNKGIYGFQLLFICLCLHYPMKVKAFGKMEMCLIHFVFCTKPSTKQRSQQSVHSIRKKAERAREEGLSKLDSVAKVSKV